jgi:TolB-like protein
VARRRCWPLRRRHAERRWTRDRFLTSALFDAIAVLPSKHRRSGGRLSAGSIQQELINQLALLPAFTKVVSAASARRFRDSTAPPAEIARTLGVRALVTGSVARTGNGLQITAQLVDAGDGSQIWNRTFERPAGDLVVLQNEVASAIAQAIEVRLRPSDRERLAARATINPATYELYLRGMHEISTVQDGGDRNAGLKFLQQAIDQDPGDPHAYAGLAKGYVALGLVGGTRSAWIVRAAASAPWPIAGPGRRASAWPK